MCVFSSFLVLNYQNFDITLEPVVILFRLDANTISRWTRCGLKTADDIKIPAIKRNNGAKNKRIYVNRFICDHCPLRFQARTNIAKHLIRCHIEKFACAICGLKFESHKERAIHFDKHDEIKSCPTCNRKVKAKDLPNHEKCHLYRKKLKKSTCSICGFKTVIFQLKKHIKSHEKFYCRECPEVLKSLAELNT